MSVPLALRGEEQPGKCIAEGQAISPHERLSPWAFPSRCWPDGPGAHAGQGPAQRRSLVCQHSNPFSRIYRFMPKRQTHLVPASSGAVSPGSHESSQRSPLHRRFAGPRNSRPRVWCERLVANRFLPRERPEARLGYHPAWMSRRRAVAPRASVACLLVGVNGGANHHECPQNRAKPGMRYNPHTMWRHGIVVCRLVN